MSRFTKKNVTIHKEKCLFQLFPEKYSLLRRHLVVHLLYKVSEMPHLACAVILSGYARGEDFVTQDGGFHGVNNYFVSE